MVVLIDVTEVYLQDQEIAWEELVEYGSAYTKAAGHLSYPLGQEKLPFFVKELMPQEFFPGDIMKNLVAANSNILPFDFIGYEANSIDLFFRFTLFYLFSVLKLLLE
jgi:hypothetical protein